MTSGTMQKRLEVDWWGLSAECQEHLVEQLINVAVAEGYAFAFYSLPVLFYAGELPMNRSMPIFLFALEDLQTATVSEWRRYGLDQEAFVFSPFLLKKRAGREFYDFPFQFLKPSVIWDSQSGFLRLCSQVEPLSTFLMKVHQIIETTLQAYRSKRKQTKADFERTVALTAPQKLYTARAVAPLPSSSRKTFHSGVHHILDEIRLKNVKKVVLSRAEHVKLHGKVRAPLVGARAFTQALQSPHHAEAMVCLFSSPRAGTWLTVSPEILVSQTQNTFRTVSLAGTQPCATMSYSKTDLRNISWRDKDIQEQVMVSRYIVDCFKILRLRHYEETGPKTVQRGHLLHLETKFVVNTKQGYGRELALDMLTLLHPTSAVAGEPLERAVKLLLALEPHERKYYSGFLGPLHLKGRTVIYVNLRCAEIVPSGIIAYAGTGIVKQSVPQLEWEESAHKLRVISELFQNAVQSS